MFSSLSIISLSIAASESMQRFDGSQIKWLKVREVEVSQGSVKHRLLFNHGDFVFFLCAFR